MKITERQLRRIIREAILTPEVADEYLDPDTPLSRKGEIESEYSMGGLGSAGFYRQLRRLRDRRRMQKRRGPAELEESVLPTMVDRIVRKKLRQQLVREDLQSKNFASLTEARKWWGKSYEDMERMDTSDLKSYAERFRSKGWADELPWNIRATSREDILDILRKKMVKKSSSTRTPKVLYNVYKQGPVFIKAVSPEGRTTSSSVFAKLSDAKKSALAYVAAYGQNKSLVRDAKRGIRDLRVGDLPLGSQVSWDV